MSVMSQGGPGGQDLGGLVEALRPLAALPAAVQQNTDELRAIRALLGGQTTGAQDPNARAAALGVASGVPTPTAGLTMGGSMPSGPGRIPSSARGGTLVPQPGPPAGGVSMAPGGGLAPVPSSVPPAGTPGGPGIGGGGGAGGGGMAPPSAGGGAGGGGQQNALGMAGSALAGMTQSGGDGIVNRAYGFATSKMPLLSVPNSIRNEYQSQINKNNYYVGMAGAGSQSEAFSYRIDEEKNRFRYGRLFNEEEARLAYKGTIAQGYNRGSDGRQGRASQREVMDAMYDAKDKAGITPEEMLNYTGTAARSATQNMSGLVESLDQLSEAVGRAGGNAQVARQQFNVSWNQGISGGMTGSAAQSWATASSMANAQLGPAFANSNPMARISGDSQYQYIVGAQMGLNSGQLTQAMNTNPTAVANAQSQTFVQYMGSYISSNNPEGWAWLKQETGSGARSPEIIAEDFVSNHFGNMDRNAYVGLAQAFGVESSENLSDPLSVTKYLVKEMSGQTTGAMLAGQQAGIGSMTMSGKAKDTGLTGSKKSLEDVLGMKDKPAIHATTGRGASVVGMGAKGPGLSDASQTYYDQAKSSGTRMGGIEQMLGQMSGSEEDKQMVEVEASDGKRIVTLAQAIKYYPNQIQSGLARFVGGKYGGKNIAAIAGGVDASAKGAAISESSQTHNTKSHGAVGRTADDYYKDHPDAKAKSGWKGPKAMIDLSPSAKKFFQITGYEDADASGEPRDNDNGMGSRIRHGLEWTSGIGLAKKFL